jgi:transposase-like protein
MNKKCAKCGKSTKGTVGLKVSKTETYVCPLCFNQWLDTRDAAVDKAFKDWIKQ